MINGIQEVLNKNILIRNQLLQKDSTMDISLQDIHTWYKKMEMIGIDRKSLDQNVDPGRLKLKKRRL